MSDYGEGGAGALTQFQAAGGSLLEESAHPTQTQPAATPPGAQQNTIELVKCGPCPPGTTNRALVDTQQ